MRNTHFLRAARHARQELRARCCRGRTRVRLRNLASKPTPRDHAIILAGWRRAPALQSRRGRCRGRTADALVVAEARTMSDATGTGQASSFNIRGARLAAFIAVVLVGCAGDTGPTGPAGQDGSNGKDGKSCTLTDNHNGTSTISCPDGTSITVPTGAQGTTCTVVNNNNGTRTISCSAGTSVLVQDAVVDYAAMTADELKAAALSAVITSVAIPADGRPVVNLKVSERHGLGVKGLSATAATWRFTLLKLDTGVNGSGNETWVSYMANDSTSTASAENATAAGLTDNKDGTYSYRFTKVINGGIASAGTTFEPTKLHRLIILTYASGNPFSPINLVRDFLPSTGADQTGSHEKFDGAACLECHTQFRAITDGTGSFRRGALH